MKKYITKYLLVAALSAFSIATMTGCSSTEVAPAEPIVNAECLVEGVEAPNWVCGVGLKSEGVYRDVGIAPISAGGIGFTRKMALADARGNLAQKIKTDVKDKVEKYISSTGIARSESIDKVATNVSKQVARVTMTGSEQIGFFQTENNVYILVEMDKSSIVDNVTKAANSSFKDDDKLWQQYKADTALKSLEKEFE
jgi:hypothetical protein